LDSGYESYSPEKNPKAKAGLLPKLSVHGFFVTVDPIKRYAMPISCCNFSSRLII
jgi:hypothetical protein